jgi:hypothetical protein
MELRAEPAMMFKCFSCRATIVAAQTAAMIVCSYCEKLQQPTKGTVFNTNGKSINNVDGKMVEAKEVIYRLQTELENLQNLFIEYRSFKFVNLLYPNKEKKLLAKIVKAQQLSVSYAIEKCQMIAKSKKNTKTNRIPPRFCPKCLIYFDDDKRICDTCGDDLKFI